MTSTFIQIIILLIATNGAPVVATRIFQSRGAMPLDLGIRMQDSRALFGESKTWRGLVAAILTAIALAAVFDLGIHFGLVFGVLVMAGDLLSSFVKRRRGLESSARCLGLDQIPESLLPSLYSVFYLGVDWWWAVLLTLSFTLIEIVISRPLYWLNIRNRPY